MSKIFLSLNNDNVFSGIIPNETYWHNDISNLQSSRLNTIYLEWAILLLGWYIILSAVPNLWIDYDLWKEFVERDTTISRPLKDIKRRQQKAEGTTSLLHQLKISQTKLLDSDSHQSTVIENRRKSPKKLATNIERNILTVEQKDFTTQFSNIRDEIGYFLENKFTLDEILSYQAKMLRYRKFSTRS
ncbi:17473_t:CDS:1 [Funneliformis geosporum]|uniref:4310_t:CDS:1 n=1 Tax=Funneliformis geosporum TaxID=1117311 RepID=A0A9W4WUT5_9GLOM|nr:17473_t:CDS:1 [Funneliformis geosporum]CAI2165236.1 4310_t:CDS:1 [Funneliformis geosporum]